MTDQQPEPEQDETVHFAGPGQWRSQADAVQPGLDAQQLADIDAAADDGE